MNTNHNMESYEGDLALGLQNRLDFGFSEVRIM